MLTGWLMGLLSWLIAGPVATRTSQFLFICPDRRGDRRARPAPRRHDIDCPVRRNHADFPMGWPRATVVLGIDPSAVIALGGLIFAVLCARGRQASTGLSGRSVIAEAAWCRHRRPNSFLDIGQIEAHIGRAAMVALGRKAGSLPSLAAAHPFLRHAGVLPARMEPWQ